MSARDVIYLITSTGATTLTRQANGWLPGTAPARARWHVVTNLIDEAFLPMDDPALRGADRRGFVELQLASRFPDSAYRAALPFRSRDRAVKSKLVLAGLGTGQAEKLIQQLVDRGEIVVGVWTLPVLLMCLLERARFKLPPTLIVPPLTASSFNICSAISSANPLPTAPRSNTISDLSIVTVCDSPIVTAS